MANIVGVVPHGFLYVGVGLLYNLVQALPLPVQKMLRHYHERKGSGAMGKIQVIWAARGLSMTARLAVLACVSLSVGMVTGTTVPSVTQAQGYEAECLEGEGACGRRNESCVRFCRIAHDHCLSTAGTDSDRKDQCLVEVQSCLQGC